MTGVSEDLVEECHAAILHDNMIISHLIVHAKQVEESRLMRRNRESKRAKSYEECSSKGRLEIQDKPRLKNRLSNKVLSKLRKACDDRVSQTKFQN